MKIIKKEIPLVIYDQKVLPISKILDFLKSSESELQSAGFSNIVFEIGEDDLLVIGEKSIDESNEESLNIDLIKDRANFIRKMIGDLDIQERSLSNKIIDLEKHFLEVGSFSGQNRLDMNKSCISLERVRVQQKMFKPLKEINDDNLLISTYEDLNKR